MVRSLETERVNNPKGNRFIALTFLGISDKLTVYRTATTTREREREREKKTCTHMHAQHLAVIRISVRATEKRNILFFLQFAQNERVMMRHVCAEYIYTITYNNICAMR